MDEHVNGESAEIDNKEQPTEVTPPDAMPTLVDSVTVPTPINQAVESPPVPQQEVVVASEPDLPTEKKSWLLNLTLLNL